MVANVATGEPTRTENEIELILCRAWLETERFRYETPRLYHSSQFTAA